VQQLPDGRFNIVVGGERRFVFRSTVEAATPYLQGAVDWFEDEPDIQVPADDEIARLLAALPKLVACAEARAGAHARAKSDGQGSVV
jgi:Lon protease-like protein